MSGIKKITACGFFLPILIGAMQVKSAEDSSPCRAWFGSSGKISEWQGKFSKPELAKYSINALFQAGADKSYPSNEAGIAFSDIILTFKQDDKILGVIKLDPEAYQPSKDYALDYCSPHWGGVSLLFNSVYSPDYSNKMTGKIISDPFKVADKDYCVRLRMPGSFMGSLPKWLSSSMANEVFTLCKVSS